MEKGNLKKGVRLNRYLARCGLGSRRACDAIIAAGKIMINGKKVTTLGVTVDPAADNVEYCGNVLQEIKERAYIAYHKSRGSLVTASDPQGRETVYDALGKKGLPAAHLKYIGRLDRNSEGLLLLTNDGELIHALTHPRFHIKKVYQVAIDRVLSREDADAMVHSGIASEGQILHAGAIRELPGKSTPATCWYEVDLYEGKNRQIRRMFEACGYTVRKLKRTQFGVVKLGGLKRGSYRSLTDREIKGLKSKGFK